VGPNAHLEKFPGALNFVLINNKETRGKQSRAAYRSKWMTERICLNIKIQFMQDRSGNTNGCCATTNILMLMADEVEAFRVRTHWHTGIRM
jgi:hypothetical protein